MSELVQAAPLERARLVVSAELSLTFTRNLVRAGWGGRSSAELPDLLRRSALVARAFGRPVLEPPASALPDIPFDPDDEEEDLDLEWSEGDAALAQSAPEWTIPSDPPQRPPLELPGLRSMRRVLGTSRLDLELLQLAACCWRHRALFEVLAQLEAELLDPAAALAAAMCTPPARVRARLRGDAPLVASGVLGMIDPRSVRDRLWLDDRVAAILLRDDATGSRLRRSVLLDEPRAPRHAEDGAQQGQDVELAADLLRSAHARRVRGVNVLVAAPSAEEAATLAHRVADRCSAVIVREQRAHEEPGRIDTATRVCALRLAQWWHRPGRCGKRRFLPLFEGLEELSRWSRPRGFEPRIPKQEATALAKLLEVNLTPTLYVTANLDALPRSVLGRFSIILTGRAPDHAERVRIVESTATWLGRDDALAIARHGLERHELERAIRDAQALGGERFEVATLERIVVNKSRAIPGARATRPFHEKGSYRLEAVNASADIGRLAELVCRRKPGSRDTIAILLSGPTGTGKSRLAWELAGRAGMPVLPRRMSDLESCWVGQTEKNLREFFQEAESLGALGLLDEVDVIARDRRKAHYGWEASRTSEFLVQLEAFSGVIACTTNFVGDLDSAVLRRFNHKIELYPANLEQALLLWEAHFEELCMERDPTLLPDLQRLGGLTPGDFGAVARRVRQLGGAWSAEDLLRELASELRARSGHERPRIGF